MSDKVLTARAWGSEVNGELHGMALADYSPSYNFDDACIIVLIPGLTHDQMEHDILAGLSLLAKSREVCEWHVVATDFCEPVAAGHHVYPQRQYPNYCSGCGRRVEVKE